MAKNQSMFFMAALLVVGALFHGSVAQTTHTVGDSTGWIIPTGSPTTYTTWASKQTFAVGDVLVFNFPAGAHDVTEVTKADYNSCTASNSILRVTTAPANVNITSAGDHYYICSFTGHCNGGQKLSITVSGSSTTTPPTSTTSSPPPPSSAASLSAMTLPIVFLSMALALFY